MSLFESELRIGLLGFVQLFGQLVDLSLQHGGLVLGGFGGGGRFFLGLGQSVVSGGLHGSGVVLRFLLGGFQIGGGLLCDTLRSIEAGTATRTPQEHDKATFAPMLSKALCPIDWTRSARQIIDHVRGLDPWPVATAELNGKRFKIYAVRPTDKKTEKAPGTLLALTKQGLEIACGGGDVLVITCLQAEGGKKMAAPDYFRGHPIEL